ncbi:MAG: aspartate kinase [Deltaproteobacteria bacterium]|nr:aspartate kinase [Deltaproteobacteria bacterium]
MKIIVQKFGGTSVGSGERLRNVAGIIQATLKTHPVIAVVSAMSGTVKAEGTTSQIILASEQALAGASYQEPLENIRRTHVKAIGEAVQGKAASQELAEAVEQELTRLELVLGAVKTLGEISPRSLDMLLSGGERLSARLLAGTLADMGTEAVYMDLSEVVAPEEKEVNPGFFLRMQHLMAEYCRPMGGKVPVVTGFFGLVPGGILKAVGRGYTDFTTALISAGLGRQAVEEMQVWKEVDGIFTADPRKVPTARVLAAISPNEAAELTYFGSEVLHPFTMERVVSAEIPIRIKNTFSPQGPGTIILPKHEDKTQRVTAVTAKRSITIVTIHSNRMFNAYGFLARVFNTLDRHGVIVDLVSTSEVSVSFSVERADSVEATAKDLKEFGDVKVERGRAILSMVGEGMKFSVGTAGQMFSTLAAAGINIEMISQGASEINISCVIKEDDVPKGLTALHKAFLEG